MNRDFMLAAIAEAEKALQKGEVPVGAVIVKDNRIIARGHNRREERKNALSHAETEVINEACKALGSWRLDGCTIYVTLEPCPMCAGAILTSRIKEVYFGAYDDKYGCFGSAVTMSFPGGFQTPRIIGGYMTEPCEELMRDFFSALRK